MGALHPGTGGQASAVRQKGIGQPSQEADREGLLDKFMEAVIGEERPKNDESKENPRRPLGNEPSR
jgi:hypothetical protein